MGVFIHNVWASVPAAEVKDTVLVALTVIVPVFVMLPHPPVNVTVYVNVPEAVGVPLIVTTFATQLPDTPAGKPVTLAPVAPVVE